MDTSLDRIDREREFHNARFAHETRDAQAKYYFAIKDGAEQFTQLVRQLSVGADILEYGCGSNAMIFDLAKRAHHATGIDISDVAVAEAAAESERLQLDNARFLTMNAEAMDFAADSFDLIYGRGIVHHLDIERSFAEVARVLRPGGKALFWEPLGHNILFNLYRRLTPSVRTEDEHPLLKQDFVTASNWFGRVHVRHYGLATLATVPLRNRKGADTLLSLTASLDRALFAVPGLRWQSWYCSMELSEPRKVS
jgi:SAM-dependent methyltransferase